MNYIETELHGILIIEPDVFGDKHGYFLETYHQARYKDVGIEMNFVQDNLPFREKILCAGAALSAPQESGQARDGISTIVTF